MWKYTILLVAFGVFLYNSHETYGQIFGYEPNVDYPAYDKIPSGLTFRCADRQPGYYADIETRCQVWHWCLPTGYMFSFLCPNGTVFNQVSISFKPLGLKVIPKVLHSNYHTVLFSSAGIPCL
uniref:Chitin-binding type-2 domain-containing protein n=1 Tax=Anopheles minimus TaxID=112268 RepID=A0A182WC56_9DIPT